MKLHYKEVCYLIFFLVISAKDAKAIDYKLVEDNWLKVEESYVEYRKYKDYRNSYVSDEKRWDFTGHFNTTYTAFTRIFWQTDLHLNATKDQVLYGGLEYRLGIHVMPYLDIFKYHLSEHVFDRKGTSDKFPVEDSYGLRVYFKTK